MEKAGGGTKRGGKNKRKKKTKKKKYLVIQFEGHPFLNLEA